MKHKNPNRKSLWDSYKFYRTQVEKPIDRITYLALCADYMQFLTQKVEEGHNLALPSGMGRIYISGRKPKIRFNEEGQVRGLAVDWKKTKALWEDKEDAKINKKLVYHTNAHSGGYRYKYFWKKRKVRVENITLYSLTFTRRNTRKVSALMQNGSEYVTKN